ncbi:MAG: hypothetical protein N3H31_02220 [Candidatus Nezhaarchaeota archaeon]|nr:hypothetical protein [Candidatus Nezhaarchaeota archaeon]
MVKRSGVSEIIASLILLLVVISLSLLVFTYSMGAFGLSQRIASYEFFVEARMLRERFSIVDAWFHGEKLLVAVFNHGPAPIKVVGMYVNDTAVSIDEPVEVEVGGTKWVRASFRYARGAVYRIKVVTDLGGERVVEAKSPSR